MRALCTLLFVVCLLAGSDARRTQQQAGSQAASRRGRTRYQGLQQQQRRQRRDRSSRSRSQRRKKQQKRRQKQQKQPTAAAKYKKKKQQKEASHVAKLGDKISHVAHDLAHAAQHGKSPGARGDVALGRVAKGAHAASPLLAGVGGYLSGRAAGQSKTDASLNAAAFVGSTAGPGLIGTAGKARLLSPAGAALAIASYGLSVGAGDNKKLKAAADVTGVAADAIPAIAVANGVSYAARTARALAQGDTKALQANHKAAVKGKAGAMVQGYAALGQVLSHSLATGNVHDAVMRAANQMQGSAAQRIGSYVGGKTYDAVQATRQMANRASSYVSQQAQRASNLYTRLRNRV